LPALCVKRQLYGTVQLMDGNIPRTGRDSRRQAILQVAREAFLAEGYAAVSMSSIAASLGGSKATLYAYFRSKAELFAAVVEEQALRAEEVLFESAGAGENVAATLRQLARRIVRLVLSEEILTIHRLAAAESHRFPELGQALYDIGPAKGAVKIAAYLEGQMTAGRLRKADALVAARQLMALCLSDLYRRRLWNVGPPPTDAEMDKQADEAVETFLAAYGIRGG
jgi:TetR/AcrR family transcriptional regulator, mexJK operon transcriptional repressor